MRPGRKPKPTALKRLTGNRGKRPLPKDEPAPPVDNDLLSPAPWLDKLAAGEWRRIAPPLMTMGLLTVVDRAALEGYCKAYSRWLQAERILERKGLCFKTPKGYVQQRPEVSIAQNYLAKMHSLAAEFGFTPASRTRVGRGRSENDADDYQKFLKERGGEKPSEPQREPGGSLH